MLHAFGQSWALVHPSAQLPNFLGAQVGGLYSDFGWPTIYVVAQLGAQVAFFGCAPSSAYGIYYLVYALDIWDSSIYMQYIHLYISGAGHLELF